MKKWRVEVESLQLELHEVFKVLAEDEREAEKLASQKFFDKYPEAMTTVIGAYVYDEEALLERVFGKKKSTS